MVSIGEFEGINGLFVGINGFYSGVRAHQWFLLESSRASLVVSLVSMVSIGEFKGMNGFCWRV